jgi:hypothetical protein
MKTIYLSGPMSNLPDLNKPAFASEEKRLLQEGWAVANPHNIVKFSDIPPTLLLPENSQELWQFCMRKDLAALVLCDAIQMLVGWEKSRGAKIEHYVALHLGLEIHYPKTNETPNW